MLKRKTKKEWLEHREELKGVSDVTEAKQSSQKEGLAKPFKCSRDSKMKTDRVSYAAPRFGGGGHTCPGTAGIKWLRQNFPSVLPTRHSCFFSFSSSDNAQHF